MYWKAYYKDHYGYTKGKRFATRRLLDEWLESNSNPDCETDPGARTWKPPEKGGEIASLMQVYHLHEPSDLEGRTAVFFRTPTAADPIASFRITKTEYIKEFPRRIEPDHTYSITGVPAVIPEGQPVPEPYEIAQMTERCFGALLNSGMNQALESGIPWALPLFDEELRQAAGEGAPRLVLRPDWQIKQDKREQILNGQRRELQRRMARLRQGSRFIFTEKDNKDCYLVTIPGTDPVIIHPESFTRDVLQLDRFEIGH